MTLKRLAPACVAFNLLGNTVPPKGQSSGLGLVHILAWAHQEDRDQQNFSWGPLRTMQCYGMTIGREQWNLGFRSSPFQTLFPRVIEELRLANLSGRPGFGVMWRLPVIMERNPNLKAGKQQRLV